MRPKAGADDLAPDPPKRYYQLIDNSPLPMAALEGTGHILRYVNPAFCRLAGRKSEELVGTPFALAVPEVDACLPLLDRVYQTGEPEDCQARWSCAMWAILGAGGRPAGVMVTVTDTVKTARIIQQAAAINQELLLSAVRQNEELQAEIEERRRAEEALRESEERFRLMVSAVKDYAIFMLSPAGEIMTWNEGAQRLTGYTPEEAIGKDFSTYFYEEDVIAGKPARELEYAASRGSFEDECLLARKDGATFQASVVITALRGVDGKLRGFSKVVRDITVQKELERARADFTAMLTHDLKSPLTTIMGYSDLLLGARKELGPDKADMVESIQRSSEKMMRMVEDFLMVSRLEAGKMQITPKHGDIGHLLERVAKDFMPAAEKKGLRLETDIAEIPLACVDLKYVERSVSNLLQNAINFTPPGGTVTLKAESGFRGDARRHGPFLAISVVDTGPGIPDGDREKIFDMYFTAPRKSGKKGTGLGLAIVKAVAEAHGGRAAVESEPGKGSAFHIYMPLRKSC